MSITTETTEITEKSESRCARCARWLKGCAGRRCVGGVAIGWLLFCAGTPVGAHHSYGSFETNRITLTGKVATFAWTSPHVIIEIDGAEENGGLRRWRVELGSPGVLSRTGWKSSDLKFGDRLIVVVNPLRSGEAGGLLVEATLADGRVLGNGASSAP
jgi:hypothetical protein